MKILSLKNSNTNDKTLELLWTITGYEYENRIGLGLGLGFQDKCYVIKMLYKNC